MPGPPQPSLPVISLKDFTPGIADLPGAQYPPTQAQRAGTFRCIAHPSGTLQPCFGRSTTYEGQDFNEGTPSGGAYLVSGFFASGPVLPSASPPSTRPHELFLATEYTTATDRMHQLERINVFASPVTRFTIKTTTVTDPSQALNGWGMTWGSTRANRAHPDVPGIPIIVAAWAPPLFGTGGFVITYPDDSAPTTNAYYNVGDLGAGGKFNNKQALVICHQSRIIIRQETVYDHGDSTVWATTEDLFFTEPNDPATVSGPESFVPESPDGYSIMAAMSAQELFALKQSGGLMIAGDFAFPTVTNLPLVAGAGDGGAYTRMGFMYAGTSTGLWVWPHGDTSQHLSPSLEPDFYKITPDYLVAQRYQWDCAENYVFLSNNWIFDTDTKAFWRLEDPDVIQCRFMDHRLQWLYGATSTYQPDALDCIYSWDMTTRATDFSWQSHPLWATLDRQVDIREITCRASGIGTVNILLTTQAGDTWSQSFDIDNPAPLLQRERGSLKGQAITVTITSTATGDGTEAPTIYEVTFDPSERQRVGQVA